MNFFRSCIYNTGPISKTKNGLEHISETCIFKGMEFCLREKSFKSFSIEYILFSLFDCFSFSIFEMMLFVFVLVGFVQLICWSGKVLLSFSFNYLNCISGLVLLCFFVSSSDALFLFYICSHSKAEKVKFSELLLPLTNGICARDVISHSL